MLSSVIQYSYQVSIGTPRKEIVVKRRKAITSDVLNQIIKLSNYQIIKLYEMRILNYGKRINRNSRICDARHRNR